MRPIRITSDSNGLLAAGTRVFGGWLVAGDATSTADVYNAATSYGNTPWLSFKAAANTQSAPAVLPAGNSILFSAGVSIRISPVTSPSISPSASASPSLSPSASVSPSASLSPSSSSSASLSPSASQSPSASLSPSASASISPSGSRSPSGSASKSPSLSISPSESTSPSASISPSLSPSASISPSSSVSPSPSAPAVETGTSPVLILLID